jgi:glycosyltransferase involved in cell wall biosynthesis
MRITIDLRMLEASGIGVYLKNIIPRLIQLRKNDFFYFLTVPGKGAFLDSTIAGNIQWIEVNSPIYSLRQQWELFRKIPGDTDLLWMPHFDIPVLAKAKMMVTVHDAFHLALPEYVGGVHKRLYARFMFGALTRKADAVCAVSEFTRQELIRLTKIDPGKISVIHQGVDPSWFNIPAGPSPHTKPFLLYVGNIKPHKNLTRLIEAFGGVQGQVPHDLLLIGQKDGFLTGDPEVEKAARKLQGRLLFTGFLAEDQLKQYYTHAEALVFPSLYEGFGLPVLEAMACGCPVISSNAASLPEVCADAAIFFDPHDPRDIGEKILEVVGNTQLKQELRIKGLSRASEFSWDKTAEQTSRLIDHVLG